MSVGGVGWGSLLQEQPFVHDLYTLGNQSVVKFYCEGKNKTVRAPLSGSFSINVQSRWNEIFGGSGGGSTLLGIVDHLAQALGNKTVAQPWFGRKMWGGTTPFKFSLPLRFISRFNAYKEVYLPMMGLLSFMYPRLNNDQQGEAGKDTADMLSTYFLPGPNIFYSVTDSEENSSFNLGLGGGDAVEIELGKFISFSGCYLTSVSLTVENSFNLDGYPHNVGAQVEFEAMDVAFVNFDGSFMETGFGNQALMLNDQIKSAVSNIKTAADRGASGLSDIFKELSGFVTGKTSTTPPVPGVPL
jgi:hypothetical protein